jgi:LysM repeat protein
MKRYIVFLIAVFGILHAGYASHYYAMDSLGITQSGGKKFVTHQVDAGETLFALSRRYKVSVQEIKDANTESLNSLNIGQKVLIPISGEATSASGKTHIVKSSETLFSISRNYNVQVEDIKRWNKLTDNSISVGQELIIAGSGTTSTFVPSSVVDAGNRKTHTVAESQTLFAISRMYGVSTDQILEWNSLTSSNLNIGQVLLVSAPGTSVTEVAKNSSMLPAAETAVSNPKLTSQTPNKEVANKVDKPAPAVVVPMANEDQQNNDLERIEAPAEKVIQKGLAEVIADTENTKKYLAMHRDAPIGTIMQVKNEMNNQTVFVRVVGRIQPTGDNGKIILMISKKAFDRLGAVDNRFPVEISFIP